MRTTAHQADFPSRAWIGALLLLASCSPAPRWIAVAGGGNESSIVLLNGDLTPVDTLYVPSDEASGQIVDIVFASDGSSLLANIQGEHTNSVLRIRRTDGVAVDQVTLPSRTERSGSIQIVDSRTILIMGRSTEGDGRGGVVFFLSATSLSKYEQLPVCATAPLAIAIVKQVKRAYVRCDTALAELDLPLRRLVRTVPLDLDAACGLGGLAPSRSGNIIYTTCAKSGQLLFLDRVTLRPLDSLGLPPGGTELGASARIPIALVRFPRLQQLEFVDLEKQRTTMRLTDFGKLSVFALSGEGLWAFVTTGDSGNRLLKVDLRTGQTTATNTLPGGTSSVAVWPGPNTPVLLWRQ